MFLKSLTPPEAVQVKVEYMTVELIKKLRELSVNILVDEAHVNERSENIATHKTKSEKNSRCRNEIRSSQFHLLLQ